VEVATTKLLGRCVVSGMVAGAALGACFMVGLFVVEVLSENAFESVEVLPVAVGAAAVVGAVAGAGVGLVAAMAVKVPLAHGRTTAARAITAVVAAIGAGVTPYLVYGPLEPGEDGTGLGVAIAVVMLVAAVTGWLLTSVLLRPHDRDHDGLAGRSGPQP